MLLHSLQWVPDALWIWLQCVVHHETQCLHCSYKVSPSYTSVRLYYGKQEHLIFSSCHSSAIRDIFGLYYVRMFDFKIALWVVNYSFERKSLCMMIGLPRVPKMNLKTFCCFFLLCIYTKWCSLHYWLQNKISINSEKCWGCCIPNISHSARRNSSPKNKQVHLSH